jgi:hypothetical protein
LFCLTAAGSLLATPLFAGPAASGAATPTLHYDSVWVADSTANSVVEYAANAHGTASPIATISGINTLLDGPSAVTVGRAGNVFVANAGSNSITEYAAGASGNVAPTAVIAGPDTGLDGPSSITLAGDELWVTNPSNNLVEAFTVGSTGDEFPAASFSGSRTKLNHPVAVSIDTTELPFLYILNRPVAGAPTIDIVDPTTPGDERPLAVITSTASHPLTSASAILAEGFANLWVANGNTLTELFVLQPGGAVERRITGAATGLATPDALSHDAFGRLVVGNAGSHEVSVFAAAAHGNVAPVRTVSGVGTAAGEPAALTVFGTAPAAPTALTSSRSGREVHLHWDAPAVTGGGVVGYDLEIGQVSAGGGSFRIGVGGGSIGNAISDAPEVTTTHRLDSVKIAKGVRYAFRVYAVNAFGTSSPSSPAHAAIETKPGTPHDVRVLVHHTMMLVAWEPPAHDGGAPHVRYHVQYAKCVPGAKGCTFRTKSVVYPFAIISGLHKHTTYHVRVVARNRIGAGKPSTVKTVKIKS